MIDLPRFMYSDPKFTQGNKFVLPNGKNYVGWYFETYNEEFYTEKEPGSNNLLLTPVLQTNSTNPTSKIFTPSIVTPTEFDRKQGYYIRYFLQDRRTKKIIEVKKEKYDQFVDLTYISGLKLKWILKKPVESIEWYGYRYEGAASKNEKAVKDAEKKFPWIKTQIKSYDEFVQ
jgi:hypothetical protein